MVDNRRLRPVMMTWFQAWIYAWAYWAQARAWYLGGPLALIAQFFGTGIKQFDKNQSVQRHLSLLMILRSKKCC